mmetsp:Transcript_73363/g.174779  ORF Transcript_73363/g.174779 Transcript_73363/m.174779 type:complete len:140 (-) Transcript_73363:2-421(-)
MAMVATAPCGDTFTEPCPGLSSRRGVDMGMATGVASEPAVTDVAGGCDGGGSGAAKGCPNEMPGIMGAVPGIVDTTTPLRNRGEFPRIFAVGDCCKVGDACRIPGRVDVTCTVFGIGFWTCIAHHKLLHLYMFDQNDTA